MSWEIIGKYLPLYQKAAVLTVKIGFIGIAAAITIGLLCTIIQYYKIPVIRRIVSVYIEISRNTPLMVQLFFIYYGLPKIGIQTDAAACGVAGLAFLGGSYMSEGFRSGVEAILCHKPYGFNVYSQGSDWTVLQNCREPFLVSGVLSYYFASGFRFGKPPGKEVTLCRVWVLRCC